MTSKAFTATPREAKTRAPGTKPRHVRTPDFHSGRVAATVAVS